MHFPTFSRIIPQLIAVLQLFECLFNRAVLPEEFHQRPHWSIAEWASLLIADNPSLAVSKAIRADVPKLRLPTRARTVNRTVNC
jgi:hypothetical protein